MDEKRLDSERRSLNRRFEYIDIVLNILKRGNEDTCQEALIRNVDGQIVLKSALMLMYYNAIEGVMNNLMNIFFETIIARNMKVSSFPAELQKLYCINHLKKSKKEATEQEVIDMINHHIDEVRLADYKELSKNISFYSGNLDSQGIIGVVKKLGFTVDETKFRVASLKTIKDKRNALAHGDVEFHEACRSLTIGDMNTIKKDLKKYLIDLIELYENEINQLIQRVQSRS